jgi:hypothetical protein
MDVKTLRQLRPPVSTFHFSFLVGDHFTNFGYHTVAKSSTPFSEVWHSGPRTLIRMTPSRLDNPLFTDALALFLPPLRLQRCKATLSAFPFFIYRRTVPQSFVVKGFHPFSYRKFLPKAEKSAKPYPA